MNPGNDEPRDRHRRAVEATLGRARDSADRGDLRDALEWLRVIEAVDGALPPGWEDQRTAWRRATEQVRSVTKQ
jgi:hypothetical protein